MANQEFKNLTKSFSKININGSYYLYQMSLSYSIADVLDYLGFNKNVIVIDYNGSVLEKSLSFFLRLARFKLLCTILSEYDYPSSLDLNERIHLLRVYDMTRDRGRNKRVWRVALFFLVANQNN